jgi:hypothetical protein
MSGLTPGFTPRPLATGFGPYFDVPFDPGR